MTTHQSFMLTLAGLVEEDTTWQDLANFVSNVSILGEACDDCGKSFAPIRQRLLDLIADPDKPEGYATPYKLMQAVVKRHEQMESGIPYPTIQGIFQDMDQDETWEAFEGRVSAALESCEDEIERDLLDFAMAMIHDETRPEGMTPSYLMLSLFDILGIPAVRMTIVSASSKEELLEAVRKMLSEHDTDE
jgi:hypothetical protein